MSKTVIALLVIALSVAALANYADPPATDAPAGGKKGPSHSSVKTASRSKSATTSEREDHGKATFPKCEQTAAATCQTKCKAHCNNGVGNGPDCRPGRARFSNDDHGGRPGKPGARGGGAAGTEYTTSNKGDNTVVNADLVFEGDVAGTFRRTKCNDDCEDREILACQPKVDVTPCKAKLEAAAAECTTKCKAHCNNGVGNGPDCRPGRARFSNDDHGGRPGKPGARGGGAAGTEYTTSNKGDNTVVNEDLVFEGDLIGTFRKTRCQDKCEERKLAPILANCQAPKEPETQAPHQDPGRSKAPEDKPAGECVLPGDVPARGDDAVCEADSWKFCGPKTTSSGMTCRDLFKKWCKNPVAVTNAAECLRSRCDEAAARADQWNNAQSKRALCETGLKEQCERHVCRVAATEPAKTTEPAKEKSPEKTEVVATPKPKEKTPEKPKETEKPKEKTPEKPKETEKPKEKTPEKAKEKTPEKPQATTEAPRTVFEPPATPAPQTGAPALCPHRDIEIIRKELDCLTRYVSLLATAVATSYTVTKEQYAQPLSDKQILVVEAAETEKSDKQIDAFGNVVPTVQEIAAEVEQQVRGIRTAGGELRGINGATGQQRLNADGSLDAGSIGAIVGSIVGAALIAAVIIAFSVVRKRKAASQSLLNQQF